MYYTARDFRMQARNALNGKWKPMILVFAIASFVSSGFGVSLVINHFFSEPVILDLSETMGTPFAYQLNRPVGFGYVLTGFLLLCRLLTQMCSIGRFQAARSVLEGERPTVKMIFPVRQIWKALVMNVVRILLIALWTMLLVIPGLVAAYRYCMADYLMSVNPELGPIEALRMSREKMMGYKGKMFGLEVSFLGWMLVLYIIINALDALLYQNGFVGAAADTLIGLVVAAVLDSYIITSRAAFFNTMEKGWSPSNVSTGYNAEDFIHRNGFGIDPSTIPGFKTMEPGNIKEEAYEQNTEEVENTMNQERAEQLLNEYRCSRNRMRKAGLLDEFEKCHLEPFREEIIRRDYARELMIRFDRHPETLKELLELAEEYHLDDLVDRMIGRIERHMREETLSSEEILDMILRVMRLLCGESFKDNPGFVERKRNQLLALTDKIEDKLSKTDMYGCWRDMVEQIRTDMR